MHNNLTEQQLKQIKYHLIGTITSDNKREVNRQLRAVDKLIKEIKMRNILNDKCKNLKNGECLKELPSVIECKYLQCDFKKLQKALGTLWKIANQFDYKEEMEDAARQTFNELGGNI